MPRRPKQLQPLQVRPDCLIFFVDETGQEDFADSAYPVFGFGGCAVMAGAAAAVLEQPWRDMKGAHFGGEKQPLHAADLRDPSSDQLDALATFFRTRRFGRFAAVMDKSASIPVTLAPYQILVSAVRKRWETIASRCSPTPSEIVFLHEASDRGDPLLERYFGVTVVTINGKRIPAHHGIVPKKMGLEGLEVADFIAQAAGRQATRKTGNFRKDFAAIFHANPLWSSFLRVTEAEESSAS